MPKRKRCATCKWWKPMFRGAKTGKCTGPQPVRNGSDVRKHSESCHNHKDR